MLILLVSEVHIFVSLNCLFKIFFPNVIFNRIQHTQELNCFPTPIVLVNMLKLCMFNIFILIHVNFKILCRFFSRRLTNFFLFFPLYSFLYGFDTPSSSCINDFIRYMFFFIYLYIFLNFLYFYIELLSVHALILIYVIYHSRKLWICITAPDSSTPLKIFPRIFLCGLLTMWILSFLPFWKILLVYSMKKKVWHIF